MKKLGVFLLVLVMMVCACASAEQAALHYSYGQDALYKHLLEIVNTVEYNGKTYAFVHGGFSFDSAFNMLGGNTSSVFEYEVPQVKLGLLSRTEDTYLGTVKISPPAEMQLYVFSGDRVRGQYTLLDSRTARSYAQDIYATRDENGVLRRIDQVYLFSYRMDGKECFYAASLNISFEGYDAAPAEMTPAGGAPAQVHTPMISFVNQEDGLEKYMAVARILEEERIRLTGLLENSDEEAALLKSQYDTLSLEKEALTEDVEQLQEQLKAAEKQAGNTKELNRQIEKLQAENSFLKEEAADAEEMNSRIEKLTAEQATLKTEAARAQSLNDQVVQLKKEKEALTASDKALRAEITSLEVENVKLEAGNTALSEQVETLRAERNALSASENALNEKVTQLEVEKVTLEVNQSALNDRLAQLTEEKEALKAAEGDLVERISALEAENAVLRTTDAAAALDQIKLLKEEKAALEAKEAELTGQLKTLKAEKAALENAESNLTAQVETLKTEKAALETEKTDLTAQIEALETEKAALEAEGTDKDHKIETLKTEYTALETEKTGLTARIAVLETEKTDLTAKVETLEADKAAQTTQLEAAKAALEANELELAGKIAQLEMEKDALEAEGTEKDQKIDTLKAENTRLESEKTGLSEQISALEGEKTDLIAKVEALESEKAALEAKEAELTGRVKALEIEKAELERKEAELTGKVEALEGEKTALERKEAELTGKVEAMESEKAALEETKAEFTGKIETLKGEKAALEETEAQLTEQKTLLEEENAVLKIASMAAAAAALVLLIVLIASLIRKKSRASEAEAKGGKRSSKTLVIALVLIVAIAAGVWFGLLPYMYNQGLAQMENREWDAAITTFNRISFYNDSRDQIKLCGEKKAQEAYEAEQARLAGEYKKAQALLDEGKFDQAIAAFTKLGNYSDASEQVKNAENAKKQAAYDAASALFNEGKYDEAIAAFTELGNYSDASEQVKNAENAKKQAAYDAASALFNEGKYDEAIAAFTELGDYSDASEQVKNAENAKKQLAYDAASALFNEGKYDEAIAAFTELGDYSDAAAQIEAVQNAKTEKEYISAVALFDEGAYRAASEAFALLGEYKDSADYLEKAQAKFPNVALDTEQLTTAIGSTFILTGKANGIGSAEELTAEITNSVSELSASFSISISGNTIYGFNPSIATIGKITLSEGVLSIEVNGGYTTGSATVAVKDQEGFVLAQATVQNTGLTYEQMNRCNDVKYMADTGFFFYEDQDVYILNFSFKDANETRIAASCSVDVRIVNEQGVTVYTGKHFLQESDFSTWTSSFYGERKLAGLRIQPDAILEGNTAKGTVYFTIKLPNGASFTESKTNATDLPVYDGTKDCSLVYPELPVQSKYYDRTTVEVTDIIHEFTSRSNGNVDLKIQFAGRKTYDRSGVYHSEAGRIGYKLYDPEGFVAKSGYASTTDVSVGERFRGATLSFYDLVPGEYKLVLMDVE